MDFFLMNKNTIVKNPAKRIFSIPRFHFRFYSSKATFGFRWLCLCTH